MSKQDVRRIKLACLPSAGMGASNFYKWNKYLKPEISLQPVEYPGHGKMIGMELLTSLDQLCDYCWEEITSNLQKDEELCILGHSLGAMVTYELVKRFQRNKDDRLKKIILCGCPAPNFLVNYLDGISAMEEEEFINYVYLLGGIAKELLDNPLFLEIYLPVIRNDFRMIESYVPVLEKVDIPMIIVNGCEDQIVRKKFQYWNWYATNQNVENHIMEGNHFFIDATKKITELINKVL